MLLDVTTTHCLSIGVRSSRRNGNASKEHATKVKEIMTAQPRSASPQTTLAEAGTLLAICRHKDVAPATAVA